MALGDAYVTVAEFKASPYFEDLDSFFANDTQIENYLLNISDIINGYCRRHFWLETGIEETFGGNGKSVYFLKNFPVQAVSGVIYKTKFSSSTGSVTSTSYEWYESGKLEHLNYFSKDYKYTVTYAAGFSDVPNEIKLATMMLARILAESLETGNLSVPEGAAVSSFKFGKYQEEYVAGVTKSKMEWDQQLPPTIASMLRKYRKGGG